jgi:hypothetical protein
MKPGIFKLNVVYYSKYFFDQIDSAMKDIELTVSCQASLDRVNPPAAFSVLYELTDPQETIRHRMAILLKTWSRIGPPTLSKNKFI